MKIQSSNKALLLSFAAILAFLISPETQAQTYPQLILGDNPVVYFRLEELAGSSTAIDSSTNGFNGTYTYDFNNAYPVLGEAGIDTNSIQFHPYTDGNGAEYGYVSVPYQPAISPSNGSPYSMEVWVRPGSLPANGNDYRCPLSDFAGFTAGNNYYGGGWLIYLEPGNEFAWDVPAQIGGTFITTGLNSVQALQWYYLTATYDGTNSTFYLNGNPVDTVNIGTNWTPNAGNPLLIGTRDLGDFPWDGNVDEVAVYGYALSSNQIAAHYALGTNSFRAQPTPPSISQSPANTTNYAGTTATFSVTADGTAPLYYYWHLNSSTNAIPGATNSTYSFVCSYAQNSNTYSVTVSNALGSTNSAAATLTVQTNILIDAQPTSIVREVGSAAAFEVVAEGAVPLTYQWYNAATTTAIPGATNPLLYLTNVQTFTNNSTYYVQVSNSYGFLLSSTVSLNVNSRSVNVPITGYARVVIADKPVAYWRLDETNAAGGTATDAVGSFDGTYNDTVNTNAQFTFGEPTGIPHETDPGVGLANGAFVSIPYAIELNPQGAFSTEGWFQPSSVGSDYRTVFSSMVNPAFAGPTGWLIYQQPSTNFALVPYSGFYGQAFITDTSDVIVPNAWYHLVVTYDGVSVFTLYVNGRAATSASFPGYVANGNVPPGGVNTYSWNYTGGGSGAAALGWRSDYDFDTFSGTVDDVAFYNYALNAQQVQLHYVNGTKLTLTRSGSQVVLSWPFGTLQSSLTANGTYTTVGGATSPYTNTPGGSQIYYRVKTQ
jgi:hypothetical protein